MSSIFRYRRLRKTKEIRDLVKENAVTPNDLMQPFFVVEGKGQQEKISSMPGIARCSSDLLLKQIEKYIKRGGKAGILFGIPKHKDDRASQAYAENGVVQAAIKAVKREFPDFLVATDVCLCAYMDHGHCGVLHNNHVDNDKTLPLLRQMAVSHAAAGADIVAPSDMMDFRVREIRQGLDDNGFEDAPIMSYAVKYASAYYGPFRDAASSVPSFGDRRTYQMDCPNVREALKEAAQDIDEGADMIMVKPALAYLDIVSLLRHNFDVPVVAYNVSGEYSMVKAAASKKWINEKDVVLETLVSMKRAGSDIIITYHAMDALKWL